MRARPHHLIDIICQYGAGTPFRPHPYGHAVHAVAERIVAHPETAIEFVIGADDVCAPCVHLVDGRCDDVVAALDPPVPKQEYNDALDRRLLDFLGMTEGQHMTFSEYLRVLEAHLDGLAEICAHPGETAEARHRHLIDGLKRLGV